MARGTALVTGASAGIGEAIARIFAANDFDLVITARRSGPLESLATDLRQQVSVISIPADLATETGVDRLIDTIDVPIDILVNNAGVGSRGDFAALTDEDLTGLLALNVISLTRLTRHYLTPMLTRGHGRILNVTSVAAFSPLPSMALYAASKAYVLSLTEALAAELKGTGVSATALCPGLTRTEGMLLNELPAVASMTPDQVAQAGYDALMSGKTICVPGTINEAAVNLAPRWLLREAASLFRKLTPG